MNFDDFDHIVFCDESSKVSANGTPYFVYCSVHMTPQRYIAVKQNILQAGLQSYLHEGEFKAQILGYRGLDVLDVAFREYDPLSLLCTVSFVEEGSFQKLSLARKIAHLFGILQRGLFKREANFEETWPYFACEIDEWLTPSKIKEIAKGANGFKLSANTAAFRTLADALRHYPEDTIPGHITSFIDAIFEMKQEDLFGIYSDRQGGFYNSLGHEMLVQLVKELEADDHFDGKKILVIHDALDKAEHIYKAHGFPAKLDRVTLKFMDSKNELGIQLADLSAWISANSFLDDQDVHQGRLKTAFSGGLLQCKTDMMRIKTHFMSPDLTSTEPETVLKM